MSKQMRGNILLFITAFIWGSAFVAQRTGMDYIGPYTFCSVRFIIASITLLPVIMIFSPNPKLKDDGSEKTSSELAKDKRTLLKGGVLCGIILFVGSILQQVGLQYTSAGKTGFITALYVVLVPIIGSLFFHRKVPGFIWFCATLATVGLYLLSISGSDFVISKGDTLVFLCAFAFALHILVIGQFSPITDGIKMSAIQFLVAGILSTIFMLFWENPEISAILDATIPILYAGVLSAGVGFTFQIIAQKDTDPTIASLIMCLESVFAVIAGVLLLNETMTMREIIGCVIMFIAITLAQLPLKNKEKILKAN
ncbi:MAG: DMT family transporter [Peptostreptococcaceae bacterium]|nr:DMT family transporter [Peptostreptococcaceae bacterium]